LTATGVNAKMLSILYKEFAVQRTAILIFAVLAVLDALLLFPLPDPLAFGTILAIFFTFSTASHEDKNNSHILLNSLPVDRKEIITAKYAFHIGIGIAFTGLAGILGALSGSWPPGTGPWQTGVFALVIIWFVSLFFPMYFWLGPRFVQVGMFFLFIILFAVMPMVYHLGVKHDFWGILDAVQSWPESRLFILTALVTAVVLMGSRYASVRIYERKQF